MSCKNRVESEEFECRVYLSYEACPENCPNQGDKDAEEETNMLEEIIILAKKYGYTVSDVALDNHRFEVGMVK